MGWFNLLTHLIHLISKEHSLILGLVARLLYHIKASVFLQSGMKWKCWKPSTFKWLPSVSLLFPSSLLPYFYDPCLSNDGSWELAKTLFPFVDWIWRMAWWHQKYSPDSRGNRRAHVIVWQFSGVSIFLFCFVFTCGEGYLIPTSSSKTSWFILHATIQSFLYTWVYTSS